jgi:acetyl esterase/lipase
LADSISARPDRVALASPVISFVDGYSAGAFLGTVDNFFGKANANEDLRQQFSNELHVKPDHPPVFVWTTADDALVPSRHSQLFADACLAAHVPVVFKLFPHGPHGLGLALGQSGGVRSWTDLFLEWLYTAGWIARPSASSPR